MTANDYDPDGEAIARVERRRSGPRNGRHRHGEHGRVHPGSELCRSRRVRLHDRRRRRHDGNGVRHHRVARSGSTNKPPLGVEDVVETGAGAPIIIDVLLNDVDPERDAMATRWILTSAERRGGVARRGHRNGRALRAARSAIRSERRASRERRCSRTGLSMRSRPSAMTSMCVSRWPGPVTTTELPCVRPDAVRLRRNVATPLPVLVNDSDPDGDPMVLTVVEPLPRGWRSPSRESNSRSSPGQARAPLAPFEYDVDDGAGHVVRGRCWSGHRRVSRPNRPPVVTSDADKTVVGRSDHRDVTSQ